MLSQQHISTTYGIDNIYLMVPITSRSSVLLTRMGATDVVLENVQDAKLIKNTLDSAVLPKNDQRKVLISLSIPSVDFPKPFYHGTNMPVFTNPNRLKGMSFFNAMADDYKRIEPIINKKKEITGTWWKEEALKLLGNAVILSHNVALSIDYAKKHILYKDPFGKPMPDYIQDYFLKNEIFAGFKIICDAEVQQNPHDHCNCSFFTIQNLRSMLSDKPIFMTTTLDNYIKEVETMRNGIIAEIERYHPDFAAKAQLSLS